MYISKKRFKYRIVSNNKKFSLNKLVKDLITCFVRKNNIKIPIKITSNFNNNDSIVINKYRNQTATIRFPEKMDQQFDLIIDYLKNSPKLSNMNITKNSNYKTKINIFPKNINKISSIEKNFKNKNVIFITDFEENLSMHNSLIKVYSVGVSKEFNDYCDEVFSPFSKGVEEILIKLRREL